MWQVQLISALGTNLIKKKKQKSQINYVFSTNKIVPWLRCYYFNKFSGFKKKTA